MISDSLRKRLDPNRPSTTFSLSLPVAVIEDLTDLAPKLGFSTPEALARFYIGQGLRTDIAEQWNKRLDDEDVTE